MYSTDLSGSVLPEPVQVDADGHVDDSGLPVTRIFKQLLLG